MCRSNSDVKWLCALLWLFFCVVVDCGKIELPNWHPDVEQAFKDKKDLPAGHPLVNADCAAASDNYDGEDDHPNLDTYFANPNRDDYPDDHPNANEWFTYLPPQYEPRIYVPSWHPDIDRMLSEGIAVPAGHPPQHAALASRMNNNHGNIDTYMMNPSANPLPSGHVKINGYINYGGAGSTFNKPVESVYHWHPPIEDYYRKGIPTPANHPKVHTKFYRALPSNHPDIDMLMANPAKYPMPDWHPLIAPYVARRSIWRPGVVVAVCLCGVFGVLVLARFVKRCCKSDAPHSTVIKVQVNEKEGFVASSTSNDLEMNDLSSKVGEVGEATTYHQSKQGESLPPRDRMRNTSRRLNSAHFGDALYEYEDKYNHRNKVIPKQSSFAHTWWKFFSTYRIPYTQWTAGNLFFFVAYLALNIASGVAVVEPDTKRPDMGLSFGSLAAVNSLVLILPATRNSILTLFLGLSFDHVILYHRTIGRWTLFCVVMHFIFFIFEFQDHASQEKYLYGFIAMICGLIIALTTFDWCRRRAFNVFYFSHYSFVGYFIFGYLHVRETRPFFIAAGVVYGVDRLMRILLMWIPRKTLVFQHLPGKLVRVRFPKNPISRVFQMHKVGQYYFVNFPRLSLTEWHPFSVSSGPRERSVELHIRALGDHTGDIVELARQRDQVWIRTDGPYGVHDFNYRRYPKLFLVGGGVGITPVVGMVKDVYSVGDYNPHRLELVPHCIRIVHCVWVVRHSNEAAAFLDTLRECLKQSRHSHNPTLVVSVYITRAKPEEVDGDSMLSCGRPNFTKILDEVQQTNSDDAMLVFACGPSPMVNELWDESISRSVKNNVRIDFHHEVFEF